MNGEVSVGYCYLIFLLTQLINWLKKKYIFLRRPMRWDYAVHEQQRASYNIPSFLQTCLEKLIEGHIEWACPTIALLTHFFAHTKSSASERQEQMFTSLWSD